MEQIIINRDVAEKIWEAAIARHWYETISGCGLPYEQEVPPTKEEYIMSQLLKATEPTEL